jgi:F0F1-type ATP synthase membrane subunit c/vacuolar-type H+-ATPase subunit K
MMRTYGEGRAVGAAVGVAVGLAVGVAVGECVTQFLGSVMTTSSASLPMW